MVRAPCCEKMGLKKGPWTPEEDHVLVTYIQQYGHGNWRALPKLAGLSRCGKSCRLRWINYLRPDIKRGNFSREEEDAIINLHQMLGNRWSAIAARLPGRTDNEIKNVWHTHLKKKLNTRQNPTVAPGPESKPKPEPESTSYYAKPESFEYGPVSPPQCTTSSADDTSSFTTSGNNDISTNTGMKVDTSEANLPEADESFWSEVLSADQNSSNETVSRDFDQEFGAAADPQVNTTVQLVSMDHVFSGSNMYDNCMDFWYNVFTRAGEIPELLEI